MSGRARRRVLIALAVLAMLALLWVAIAGRLLVSTDEIGRPDVVVALSGDPLGDRVARAIEVAAGSEAARLIIFRDGGAAPETPSEIRRRAARAGVPESSIRFMGPVDSTAMEAGLTAGLARRCGWDEVLIVTSPYHTRRAAWTFRRTIGDATTVRITASEETFDAGAWWRTSKDRLSVMREWAKGLGSLSFVVRPPGILESETAC